MPIVAKSGLALKARKAELVRMIFLLASKFSLSDLEDFQAISDPRDSATNLLLSGLMLLHKQERNSRTTSTSTLSTKARLTTKAHYLDLLRELHLIASKFTTREFVNFGDTSLEGGMGLEQLVKGLRQIRSEEANRGFEGVTSARVSVRRALDDLVLFENTKALADFASLFFQTTFGDPNEGRNVIVNRIMRKYISSEKLKQGLFKQALTQRMKALLGPEDKKYRDYYEAWARQIKGG